MARKRSGLSGLRNIGPTIEARLREIGVNTRKDLARLGAAEAYGRIRAKHPGRTMSVCYYLYSLQGALMDTHWDDLPETMKADLRRKAGHED
jgi:TfoX C-terminal domain